MIRPVRTLVALCVAALPAQAQGLYDPVARDEGALAQPLSLEQVSTLFIKPPDPHVIRAHDLVTIVIDESSTATSEQSLETERDYDTRATINSLIDPWALLELQLRQGNLTDVDLVRATAARQFEGDGEYERRDRFSARITATVLEVKPNGTLLLEARKHVVKDEETQTLVLSGLCRQEDVTNQNTVLSSQIADLSIVLEHDGQVRDAATKGILARVLDAVFAF